MSSPILLRGYPTFSIESDTQSDLHDIGAQDPS